MLPVGDAAEQQPSDAQQPNQGQFIVVDAAANETTKQGHIISVGVAAVSPPRAVDRFSVRNLRAEAGDRLFSRGIDSLR